jgi:hypothetical protein
MRNCPVWFLPRSRAAAKLVASGSDAGVHHLADVYSGHPADDDQLHPHHHRFGLLRNALGTPSAPPNQVLLGLALFLTFFIMSPVIDKIYRRLPAVQRR